jgi:alkylation response protein AidB-like acyl-CoA dehydrogenase
MDLSYGPEYEVFRLEVRQFIADHWKGAPGDEEAIREFRELAARHGYMYRLIPKDYGGGGEEPDPLKSQVIREELALAKAPNELGGLGVQMLAATLLDRGQEWQKKKFIPKTLTGEYIWCQGYSEPGSGSDLASLRTSAVLIDDTWVINGQKVWTTGGHFAHYMFMLCRTEPEKPKHEGISYLLVDMQQPGIEVRPLKQITGTSEFNEVFFTDATTPADWIVGERGQGWSVANTTLAHERNMVGSVSASDHLFNSVIKLAKRRTIDGRPAIEDKGIRDELVRLQGYLESQRYSGMHQFTKGLANESAGVLPMLNKLAITEFGKQIAELALKLLGGTSLLAGSSTQSMSPTMAGLAANHGASDGTPQRRTPGDERFMNQYLGSLGMAIAGGTSNIQRNIIAERGLGLPKDAPSAAPAERSAKKANP